MFSWFRKKPAPEAPAPVVPAITMTANPLAIGERDPVEYARYRLDCIRRHLETHGGAPDDRMLEFRQETFDLVSALHKAQAITLDEEAVFLKRVGIGG